MNCHWKRWKRCAPNGLSRRLPIRAPKLFPAPNRPALPAHVLVAKYAVPLPLYRQSERYAREGVDLSRSTLADWGQCHTLLRPRVDALKPHVFAAEKPHADPPHRCRCSPLGKGRPGQGAYRTYVRDDRPWGEAPTPCGVVRLPAQATGRTPAGAPEKP